MAGLSSNQEYAILDGSMRGTNIETFSNWKELAQSALYRLSIQELEVIKDEFIPECIAEKLE